MNVNLTELNKPIYKNSRVSFLIEKSYSMKISNSEKSQIPKKLQILKISKSPILKKLKISKISKFPIYENLQFPNYRSSASLDFAEF